MKKTKEDAWTPVVQYVDVSKVVLENGQRYAFHFGGRDFFAVVFNNGVTGRLEMIEVPDPGERGQDD